MMQLANSTTRRCAISASEPLWKRARRRAIDRVIRSKKIPKASLSRQRVLALWLLNQNCDWHLTINSNDPRFDHARGRVALKRLDALLDRRFLGKRWYKYPSSERTLFFAIPEYAGGEIHYHILVKLPLKARCNRAKALRFAKTLTGKIRQKQIFPCGDAHATALIGRNELESSERHF